MQIGTTVRQLEQAAANSTPDNAADSSPLEERFLNARLAEPASTETHEHFCARDDANNDILACLEHAAAAADPRLGLGSTGSPCLPAHQLCHPRLLIRRNQAPCRAAHAQQQEAREESTASHQTTGLVLSCTGRHTVCALAIAEQNNAVAAAAEPARPAASESMFRPTRPPALHRPLVVRRPPLVCKPLMGLQMVFHLISEYYHRRERGRRVQSCWTWTRS